MVTSLKRTPSQQARLEDAHERVEEAAKRMNCMPGSLREAANESNKDCFYEGTTSSGEALFFKARMGSRQQLVDWAEPAQARWAERAGCGARVFDSPVEGVLITEFLPGQPLTREEANQPAYARQVARLLYQMHHAEPVGANALPENATGAARSRAQDALAQGAISEKFAKALIEKADWLDLQLSRHPYELRQRFGDCHFGNWIRVADRLYAIDLADSRPGDAMADLARYAFCQRFDHTQLQQMLTWYAEAGDEPVDDRVRRRLRLNAMAQNLDYFGYFASLTGAGSPHTRGMAQRLLDDEAAEPECPRAPLHELLPSVAANCV